MKPIFLLIFLFLSSLIARDKDVSSNLFDLIDKGINSEQELKDQKTRLKLAQSPLVALEIVSQETPYLEWQGARGSYYLKVSALVEKVVILKIDINQGRSCALYPTPKSVSLVRNQSVAYEILCENQPLWIEVSTNLGKRTFQF
ncbi:hypothetical protein [Helicobacter acinonychis]|uniref:Uncharacterized protein n=1 Tax=Helicobacter acinonychis (strain Sheeba) TaxID=382638 RepID=Q17XV5_HELAH|nr:hypothetical protein [Helicobacter acinonychis]CAJ99521.1 conserved hypothetical protein [Helicobacter acinonychis str. Sheeba]STP04091.1 Uncharacterised protein [Helicobacter acinonychis]